MNKVISSIQNPLVKRVLQLSEKSRARKKEGVFIIEGIREISLCLKGDYSFETLLFCPLIISEDNLIGLQKQIGNNDRWVEVTAEVYGKIAYRGSTEGIIALVHEKDLQLGHLKFSNDHPLILVAEAPEKPGNIGALLRTADAAGLDAVIIANPRTDLYNPNIIRSSVGCLFTNQIAYGTTEEIISFLKKNNIAIYCAALQASISYIECDYSQASAMVVGTEAHGLSASWLENSTQNIIIPMHGEIDSMNVSVAAGILIFEAKRQRGFNL